MAKNRPQKRNKPQTETAQSAVAVQNALVSKRAMILSARLRYSPSGATIRDKAVDPMIEQILAEVTPKQLNSDEAVASSAVPEGPRVLTQVDVVAGFERLSKLKKMNENWKTPDLNL